VLLRPAAKTLALFYPLIWQNYGRLLLRAEAHTHVFVEIVQPGRIQSTSEYPFTFFRLPPRAQVIGSEPSFLSQAARCSCATCFVKSLTSSLKLASVSLYNCLCFAESGSSSFLSSTFKRMSSTSRKSLSTFSSRCVGSCGSGRGPPSP